MAFYNSRVYFTNRSSAKETDSGTAQSGEVFAEDLAGIKSYSYKTVRRRKSANSTGYIAS